MWRGVVSPEEKMLNVMGWVSRNNVGIFYTAVIWLDYARR